MGVDALKMGPPRAWPPGGGVGKGVGARRVIRAPHQNGHIGAVGGALQDLRDPRQQALEAHLLARGQQLKVAQRGLQVTETGEGGREDGEPS